MKFWKLVLPRMSGPFPFAETVRPHYGDATTCDVCHKFITMKPWLPPHEVRLQRGLRSDVPADIITGAGFSTFLASEKFINVWSSNHLTGVTSWVPVAIKKQPDSGYSYAIVPPPSVQVDYSHMHVVFEPDGSPTCPQCHYAKLKDFRGVTIDERTWEGQDLFDLLNIGLVMTDGAVKVLEAEQITGMLLVPLDEYEPITAEDWAALAVARGWIHPGQLTR